MISNRSAESNDITLPTVAAISTPYGRGGVALLRVSGEEALAVAAKVFCPAGKKPLDEITPNRAVFGRILSDGEEIDEGILTFFRAPHSFTGEDVVEISCHGGVLITGKVYEALLLAGAEPAAPGEFTKRAFMNGKMSLGKAESVIDLIDAENEHQLRLASKNAGGALDRRIDGICRRITDLLADIYVGIDYPDEDLEELSGDEALAELKEITESVKALCASYRTGNAIAHGVKTAIVGLPNTGKSSLLNLLSGKERAIVSSFAGTTRDTIEESVNLGKVTLRLVDTAGLRDSSDPIEKEGILRSRRALCEAELIFAVFDGSREASDDDASLIEELKKEEKPVIALLNKKDLPELFDTRLLEGFPIIRLSAKEKKLPEELVSYIETLYGTGKLSTLDEGLLTNARMYASASAALALLSNASAALSAGEPVNIVALTIEEALVQLRNTDGRAVSEEIVSSIFSRFCVGK